MAYFLVCFIIHQTIFRTILPEQSDNKSIKKLGMTKYRKYIFGSSFLKYLSLDKYLDKILLSIGYSSSLFAIDNYEVSVSKFILWALEKRCFLSEASGLTSLVEVHIFKFIAEIFTLPRECDLT